MLIYFIPIENFLLFIHKMKLYIDVKFYISVQQVQFFITDKVICTNKEASSRSSLYMFFNGTLLYPDLKQRT